MLKALMEKVDNMQGQTENFSKETAITLKKNLMKMQDIKKKKTTVKEIKSAFEGLTSRPYGDKERLG